MEFRKANINDLDKILEFIYAIAEYEKMTDQVVASKESLKEWIFEKGIAEVSFVLEDNKEVGYAIYFYNFSTFEGRSGLYLEDIFVYPEYRGKGYGKGLFKHVLEIAVNRGCPRVEWCCLNWNKPSIDFYKSFNAKPMDEWTTYRLSGNSLKDALNK